MTLSHKERCWTGFGWPGRDRDRRPAWRPRPPDGYLIMDGLRCSIPVTALIQCPALISLLRYQWTSDGWEDPLGARTPTHGAATWSRTGANAWRRIAPKLSTTWDSMRGASTKRRYFWLGGLLA